MTRTKIHLTEEEIYDIFLDRYFSEPEQYFKKGFTQEETLLEETEEIN